MTKEMREIVDFEIKQSQELSNRDFVDPYDKQGYINSRKYWNEGGPAVLRTIDEVIQGPYGQIPLRFYYPNEEEKNRCIIYIHGGGFVLGSIDSHDGIIRRLANATGATIVGIDYRLAPDYKFPVPIEECQRLVEFLHKNGDKYNINRDNISLAGDSAGAFLSLATCLYMRDNKDDISYIKSLLLYYGSYGLGDSMSKRLYGGYWDGLTAQALDKYEEVFTDPKDRSNPYRLLFNSDLTYGIPPTYIMCGGLDPLLDDSRLLYEILKENNITSELKIYKGLIHGFLHFSKKLAQAVSAIEDSARFYRMNTK